MTYVLSGLSGSTGKYEKLKKQAKIKDSDTVYIIGGLACGNLSLLCELSMCANVYPVMDKNGWTALRMLGKFEKMVKSGAAPDEKYIAEMKEWVADGGQAVLDAFRSYDNDMKEGILDFLGEFSLFEETDAGGSEFVLLSAGIAGYTDDCDLYELEPVNFISEPLDMTKKYFPGKLTVTAEAKQGASENVARDGDNICLDCGKTAVCLRLEDLSAFYA